MSAASNDDSKSATRNSGESSPRPPPDAEPPAERPVADERPNYSIFTSWQKKCIVMGAAAAAFFSPLNAQIYFPALTKIASDLHVSISQVNLTVTTYMVSRCSRCVGIQGWSRVDKGEEGEHPNIPNIWLTGAQILQGVTPMFIGSFADAIGRRPAYFVCFVIYIAANIGCALAPNYAALLVLRMLQSAGSSTTVALCQGVVADIITSAERAEYVAFVSLPVMIAPALGPVLGGIISQYLSWRWIFWILSIMAGVVFVGCLLFMPETCRHIVGDGSIKPHPFYRPLYQNMRDAVRAGRARRHPGDRTLQHTVSRASTRRSLHFKKPSILTSLRILADLEMFLLLMYSAIMFAGFYAIATSLATQVAALYGYDELKIGLLYLPMAGGSVVAALATGRVAGWNYRRHCKRLGVPFERKKQQDMSGFPIERARLEIAFPLLLLATAVMLCWGWSLQYRASVAVPCVLLFLQGICIIGFSNMSQTLLTDLNAAHAGAATASNNLTRCLLGAAATAVINPMIDGIGLGWSFTIVALCFLVFSPSLLYIMKNGVKWRQAKAEKRRLKEEAERAQQQSTDVEAALDSETEYGATPGVLVAEKGNA
jgi:multidrug resistance protein